MLTKDVSLVSILALLASVELETQRAERKREGARERMWREYPWASTMHVLLDQKHDQSGERRIKTRHIISAWERAGASKRGHSTEHGLYKECKAEVSCMIS